MHQDKPGTPSQGRLPIGIVVVRDRREAVVQLIPAGSPLPHRLETTLEHTFPGQTAVELVVTIGEGSTRSDVRIIGVARLTDLAPAAAGSPIVLLLEHTVDRLRVVLTDTATETCSEITIELSGM